MPAEQKAIVSYVELLKEDLVIIRFVPKEGMPDYQTGQFLTLSFPIPDQNYEMIRRAYSICSHPENKKFFELVIRWVRKCQELTCLIIWHTFLWNKSNNDKILF